MRSDPWQWPTKAPPHEQFTPLASWLVETSDDDEGEDGDSDWDDDDWDEEDEDEREPETTPLRAQIRAWDAPVPGGVVDGWETLATSQR